MAIIKLNAATKFIKELYQNHHISIVKAKRYINANAKKRGSIDDGHSKKLLRAQALICSKSILYRAFALMRPKVIALALALALAILTITTTNRATIS